MLCRITFKTLTWWCSASKDRSGTVKRATSTGCWGRGTGWHCKPPGCNSPMGSWRNADMELDRAGFRGKKEKKKEIASITYKTKYKVNLDVIWNCRPMNTEQKCKRVLADWMYPKMILDWGRRNDQHKRIPHSEGLQMLMIHHNIPPLPPGWKHHAQHPEERWRHEPNTRRRGRH